jgi:hypothetical protein
VKSINRSVIITRFRQLWTGAGSVPQILPPRRAACMHYDYAVESAWTCWRGLDAADLMEILWRREVLWYTLACQFECDCSSGSQDCGWGVFSGRYFANIWRSSTACRLHDVRLRYVYTPMVNQVQNNSTLAVGPTTKILSPQWVLDWRVPKNYLPHGWRHPKNKMARTSQLN